jgi:hypothetical protein
MSVVIGCSLINGILMAADCRATFLIGTKETHRDTAQKLLGITPHTAIGFVGDIQVAADLLLCAVKQLRKRRNDPISLALWLPRMLRHFYRKRGYKREVSFMVGSVIKNRPNAIAKAAAMKVLNYTAFTAKRGTAPSFLFEIIQAKHNVVHIPDAPAGVLYVMHSPDFKAECYYPLQYGAIGSGSGITKHIEKVHDLILTSVNEGNVDAMFLGPTLQALLNETDISTVGGMLTMIKITGDGVQHLIHRTGAIPDGPFYELGFEKGRWIQKNTTTGKEIPLVYPWNSTPTNQQNTRSMSCASNRIN